jgi:flagellin-like protein
VFVFTFFGEFVSRLFVRRRAVSEIVGAVLVAMITIAMAVAYVMAGRSTAQSQVLSMVDLIRAAERRQRQLLSLTYAYKDGSGNLHLFIYNYGSETSTPDKLYLAEPTYVMGSGQYTFDMKQAGTNTPVPCIGSKQLVELTATPAPSQNQFDIILTTAEGGIFIWKFQG